MSTETSIKPPASARPSADGAALPAAFAPIVFALVACILAPVWLCPIFPSQNAPPLLSVADIVAHYDDPDYGYSAYYDLHFFPVPYWFQFAITIPLLRVASPTLTLQILVTLLLLFRVGAILFLLRQIDPRRALYGIVGLAFAYEFILMRGYFNFHAGISMALIVIGWHLRHRDRWTASSIAIWNLLILIVYFCHPIPLAATGVLIAAYEFQKTLSLGRIFGVFFRGFVPAVTLLVAFFLWSRSQSAWGSAALSPTSIVTKIQNIHYRGATPLSPLANWISLSLLAIVGIIALRKCSFGLLKSRKSNPESTGDSHLSAAWLAVWFCAMGLYLIMPGNLLGWHKADLHLLPFVFLLTLTLAPPLLTRRAQWAFLLVASSGILIGLVPVTQDLLRRSALVESYLAGMEVVPRKVKLLSIASEEKERDGWSLSDAFDSLQWADSYYAMASGGGLGRGLIANNTLYPAWFKDYRDQGKSQFPPVNPEGPRDAELQSAAATYGAVILWDDATKLRSQFEKHGFEPAYEQGSLLILTRTVDHPAEARGPDDESR